MNLKRGFFEGKKKERISHEDPLAAENLATELISHFPTIKSRPIVFVCIGTDRSTGDSLGPLTGTLLLEKNISSFFVYGTLDDPIHAVNLAEKLKEIHEKHFHPFIIGIDACLGRVKNVGMIEIGDGPVQPGAGVNKELPEVGSIHITGIVNVSGFMEFFVLQNTRLNLVLKIAKTIANGIYKASILYSLKSERSEYQSPISKEKLN
jgi:putative sporulation protein YyaC